jgi:hypothetical protein
MRCASDLISLGEERAPQLPRLLFKEFEFHGFLGKRRTASLGWHYDFSAGGLKQAGEPPSLLLAGEIRQSRRSSCRTRMGLAACR